LRGTVIGTERKVCRWVERGGRGGLGAEHLESELQIPRLIGEILARRGFSDVDTARTFLSPNLETVYDPFLLPDMEKAAHRLWRAVDEGERILVHGDYDVDGETAVSLLVRFFGSLGTEIFHSVPNRLSDGYGLSERAIRDAESRGATVLITVDCGISEHEHVARAQAIGIDCVVTDHHLPSDTLPPAVAVVAPSRPDSLYPTSDLAGVGVAYKLLQAMTRLRPATVPSPDEGLDLVALGTVADVVPLRDENRVFVAHGLQKLRHPERPGLRALKEVAGLAVDEPVSAGQVAFRLAPRLNAAGRLGTAERAAERAVELLLARTQDEAMRLARELDEENRRRRDMDQRTLDEALEQIEAEGVGGRRILVVGSPGWHPGVIGIVASRLVRKFHLPVILVAFDDGVGKGSGRSIEGFDLAGALARCQDWLVSCGGHEQAAGLAVMEKSYDGFRKEIERIAFEKITEEMTRPTLEVDGVVELEDCTLNMLEWVRMMEPFGAGNPEPVLASLRNRVVGYPRTVGGGHLKFTVQQGSSAVDAIGFGMGDRIEVLESGGDIDLAFALSENRWGGFPKLQLKIKDIRVSEPAKPARRAPGGER